MAVVALPALGAHGRTIGLTVIFVIEMALLGTFAAGLLSGSWVLLPGGG